MLPPIGGGGPVLPPIGGGGPLLLNGGGAAPAAAADYDIGCGG